MQLCFTVSGEVVPSVSGPLLCHIPFFVFANGLICVVREQYFFGGRGGEGGQSEITGVCNKSFQ